MEEFIQIVCLAPWVALLLLFVARFVQLCVRDDRETPE